MATIKIGDTTIYEGPMVAVPQKGDEIHHDGAVVRVEGVTWEFGADKGGVVVTLVVGERAYTF